MAGSSSTQTSAPNLPSEDFPGRHLVLSLQVAGLVVAQPRHRMANRGGKLIAIEAYTKHPIHAWKDSLRFAAQNAMLGRPPVDFALRLEALFLLPRPKAMLAKKKLATVLVPVTRRPDVDNMIKAVFDSLNLIVWVDDSQISTAFIRKRYVLPAEQPGVILQVWREKIPW